MFETQNFGNKTSSGEIGLNTGTHASPNVGQDQMSGGASSVGMPHPLQLFYDSLAQLGKRTNSVIRSSSVTGSKISVMTDQWKESLYMVILKNVV